MRLLLCLELLLGCVDGLADVDRSSLAAEASGRDHESRWRDWVRHKSKDASVRLQQSLRRWREAPGGKERQMREQR